MMEQKWFEKWDREWWEEYRKEEARHAEKTKELMYRREQLDAHRPRK